MHTGFPYEARFLIITCLDYASYYINFPIPQNHPSKKVKLIETAEKWLQGCRENRERLVKGYKLSPIKMNKDKIGRAHV